MPHARARSSPRSNVSYNGKYSKLWRRFYEPLVLLSILGSTRGRHSDAPVSTPLHRFLDNLAYICDHQKGGNTTSAVAIEDTPQLAVFWVASNCPNQCGKTVPFLRLVLESARAIADSCPQQRGDLTGQLVRECFSFAQARVKKEEALLRKEITKCMGYLRSIEDLKLVDWLSGFVEKEGFDLCVHAYAQRDSAEMRRFNDVPRLREDVAADSVTCKAIAAVTHRLGRLAHHIRAPQKIVQDVIENDHLRNVLDEFTVQSIGGQDVVVRPAVDADVSMHGIMNRMLPKGEIAKPQYRDAASVMNHKYAIVDRFRQQYGNSNFKPTIHAEVQVLEHFWVAKSGKRRHFFEDDRYVGCSKPACYCCHLYFEAHPAKCVIPQTSKRIYLNWGLRNLAPPSSNNHVNPSGDGYVHQRDMLNKMVQRIRDDALDQILRKAEPPALWHPDSLTGFTWAANNDINILSAICDESDGDDSDSGGGARLQVLG
ncbi:hypothetical protein F5Y17DRAFT_449070 [Xylariaceae sp. FL0594]|nr:hypothetical protein F5Y17DRAFT_449070 [Xylariaceae sp. FL0594]